MPVLRRRLSPSLVVATLALILAAGGTAVAAGEIITRPDQIATGVIDARHVASDAVGNAELERKVLRVRVAADGTATGPHPDATIFKSGIGAYHLRFGARADGTGPRTPLDMETCTVTATRRGQGKTDTAMRLAPGNLGPSSLLVSAMAFDLGDRLFRHADMGFDVIAIC